MTFAVAAGKEGARCADWSLEQYISSVVQEEREASLNGV